MAAGFAVLQEAAGDVVPAQKLAAAMGIGAWHYTDSRALALQMSRLRKAIKGHGYSILAARGTGYLLRKVA